MLDISKFYVIAVCSNPIRYNSRWRLFKQFEKHITDLGAKLLIVEQAFGRREFQLTSRENKMHLQVRTDQELWHKENMVNLGINYLCQIDPDWQYVAWIDGDIQFQRQDIILETAQQLQHFHWVQMFSHAIDLGPNGEFLKSYNGFMWSYFNNRSSAPHGAGYGGYYMDDKQGFWHPGFAWAARRSAVDRVMLLDKAILGAGDHHMALCLIGEGHRSVPGGVTAGYRDMVMNWQEMVTVNFKRNVGFVPGVITHNWHGKKANRKYIERWDILVKNKYNPTTDITRDSQGLYRLTIHDTERFIRLRDDIRRYFRERNEDSIDLN